MIKARMIQVLKFRLGVTDEQAASLVDMGLGTVLKARAADKEKLIKAGLSASKADGIKAGKK